MPMPLQDIEAEALQLPLEERGLLVGRLLLSLEPELQDSPESISKAWDEEIARRIDDMEAGRTDAVPYEQVRAELRAIVGRGGSRYYPSRRISFTPGGKPTSSIATS